MKIVICGAMSNFTSYMIDKLVRDSHNVYLVTETNAQKISYKSEKVVVYNISLENEYAQYVMSSISPDVIIFMGAHDKNYKWEEEQGKEASYLSSLASLFIISAALDVKRFIYISDYSVYGAGQQYDPQNLLETSPDTIKGVMVQEGERVCLSFSDILNIPSIILRINNVYGPPNDIAYDFDSITEMCAEAVKNGYINLTSPDKATYTYVRDAVDAVFRAVTEMNLKSEVFNVSGDFPASQGNLASFVKMAAEAQGDEMMVVDRLTEPEHNAEKVDNSIFAEHYKFREFNTTEQGVEKVYIWAKKNKNLLEKRDRQELEEVLDKKAGHAKRSLRRRLMPYIETVALFILATVLFMITKDTPFLQNIDFLLLFVVIAAAAFGKQQALIATLGAAAVYVYDKMLMNYRAVDIFINYDFIIRLFTLFTIGIVVGHTRDRMREYIKEKDEQITHLENELVELTEIHSITLKIKQVLEDRLINYGDSLAKIYSVVSELESLQPQKILINAVSVIMRIIGSRQVSIYYYDAKSGYCRLVAASSKDMEVGNRKSMKLAEMPDVSYSLTRGEVYVNRDVIPERPLMASPVFMGESLISLIMIWDMDFDKLNPYQTNLLAVLTRMITASIEKAYVYEDASRETKLIEGTYLYNEEAMEEYIEIANEAMEMHDTQFILGEITADKSNAVSIGNKVASQVRTYDYVGLYRNRLVVLLSNTTDEEANFFITRMKSQGIEIKILKELA